MPHLHRILPTLVLGVLFLVTSCLEVKEDDRYPYAEDELMGTWETEIPLHQDEWTGITGVDLLADNQATIHLVDATGRHEHSGTWNTEKKKTVGPVTFEFDLMLNYQEDPQHTKTFLGVIRVEEDHLVFSAHNLELHKQE